MEITTYKDYLGPFDWSNFSLGPNSIQARTQNLRVLNVSDRVFFLGDRDRYFTWSHFDGQSCSFFFFLFSDIGLYFFHHSTVHST